MKILELSTDFSIKVNNLIIFEIKLFNLRIKRWIFRLFIGWSVSRVNSCTFLLEFFSVTSKFDLFYEQNSSTISFLSSVGKL